MHEVEQSRFDGRQYVRAAPGWVHSLEPGRSGYLGGPFKLGAMVHSDGSFLIARVDEITRITALEVRVGDQVYDLEKVGWTDLETSFEDPYDTANSEARFRVDLRLLRQMTMGGRVLVRVTTGEGYREGDFGATCALRWPDRSCVAVRKVLAEARRLGLVGV